MRILRAKIENFRGIKEAEIDFPKHTLLVGPNNACKSTVLEALNLVLGPDRARGTDIIDEHDFYQGEYRAPDNDEEENEASNATDQKNENEEEEPEKGSIAEEGSPSEAESSEQAAKASEEESGQDSQGAEPPEISIEVTLCELNESDRQRFRSHFEYWNEEKSRIYTSEELEQHDPDEEPLVLRVGFRGWYEREEDEFRSETFFLNPEPTNGSYDRFGRRSKQEIGFLYLRSLRTGNRAASLERGSLLDTLLREKTERTQLWETILEGLKETGEVLEANGELQSALDDIRGRIERFIPLAEEESVPASTLRPGRLTRQHLRETITYFLASRDSTHPLPFDRLGGGTSNVIVFALLSAIADEKDNVIFAMEEPEIALPPHTQRVIVERLRDISSQSILSSHSPYVAELFLPDSLVVLNREKDGSLPNTTPDVGQSVKEKTLRRDFRTRFAEGLLARAVVLVEGVTELWGLPAAVETLARVEESEFVRFYRDGVVFLPAGGTGELDKLASYFDSLGIEVFVVCDQLEPHERQSVQKVDCHLIEHPYGGFERVIADELDLGLLKDIADEWTGWNRYPTHLPRPGKTDDEDEWRDYFAKVLKNRKGEAYAERVLSKCGSSDIPSTIVGIIQKIHLGLGRDPIPESDSLSQVFDSGDISKNGSSS